MAGPTEQDQIQADTPAPVGDQTVAHAPAADNPLINQVIDTAKEQWTQFEETTKKFWTTASSSRKTDSEVLSFPPKQPEISKPKDEQLKPGDQKKPSLPLLSINDMVKRFPDLKSLVYTGSDAPSALAFNESTSDSQFRAQYVKSIQEMSRNHGLTDQQVQDVIIKLYAFETGGDGGFDTVAGMTKKSVSGVIDTIKSYFSDEIPLTDHDYVPTNSTAIGYKQLIMATTMSNIFIDGKNMSEQLTARANEISDPVEKARLLAKADFIGKLPDTMMQLARQLHLKDNPKVLEDKEYQEDPEKYWRKVAPWNLFNALSRSGDPINLPDGRTMTGREFTSSIQGLNVDNDLGPLIQASQLRSLIQDWSPDSTRDPKEKGNESNNLKTSLDSFVANANNQIKQFDESPYEDKVKALDAIIAQALKGKTFLKPMESMMMDTIRRKLTQSFKSGIEPDFQPLEKQFMFDNLLLNKVFLEPGMDGKSLSSSPEGQDISRLFYKLNSIYYGGLTAEKLTPAVFELANLLGAPQARRMLDPAHSDWRTVNFTDQRGYNANSMIPNRSAAELLLAIHRVQNGPKADESHLGIKAFRRLFKAQR